jgi:alkylation response protein AidB-like acyl-CoA dehydrogenase
MAQPKDFGFGEEEKMLRDSARRLLEKEAGIDTLRRSTAGSHEAAYESDIQPAEWNDDLWKQMVALGWTTLGAPEEAGGVDMKMVAMAALAEEAGRAALPSPLVATLLATRVLRAAARAASAAADGPRTALERIVGGTPTSLGITDEFGSWEARDTSVAVRKSRDSYVLEGTAYFVQDARKARQFIVSARGDAGVGLFAVDASAPGLTIVPDQIVDLTRDQARLSLDGVEAAAADIISAPGDGDQVLDAATPDLLTIVAADMCGAAEWQLQTTVEYAQIRTQFDHPLGFFQAVKHPIVNMMIDIDRARSLVYNAACAIDTEPERALRFARMAKAAATDTAAFCSSRSVQLHGGIGFTWECDVHLWFKRQLHNQAYLGDAAYQRGKLSELIA